MFPSHPHSELQALVSGLVQVGGASEAPCGQCRPLVFPPRPVPQGSQTRPALVLPGGSSWASSGSPKGLRLCHGARTPGDFQAIPFPLRGTVLRGAFVGVVPCSSQKTCQPRGRLAPHACELLSTAVRFLGVCPSAAFASSCSRFLSLEPTEKSVQGLCLRSLWHRRLLMLSASGAFPALGWAELR